jgi:TRAP-type uncharacterized transport system substrate-binding protein
MNGLQLNSALRSKIRDFFCAMTERRLVKMGSEGRFASFLALLAVLAAYLSPHAFSQQANREDPYAAASDWTVGIMTGAMEHTELNMASDLAAGLNDGADLRIVPLLGESSIRNVTDLFHLSGVDAAIVQSDVLAYLRRSNAMPGIDSRLNYVAKLHSAEFHVLARMNYMCIAELSGRKVNFGPAGSGGALTAQAVFEAAKVEVQPLYLPQNVAADQLRRGELDAVVFVSGKPATAFSSIRYTDRVHFLDVDFSDSLQRDYLPAILTHDDYPDLIAAEETVSTIAVSAVLAVAKTPERSEQYAKLDRMVDRLFTNIERFRKPPNHAKWREVTLSAPVNGWTRFPGAQQWLKAHPDSIAASGNNAQQR